MAEQIIQQPDGKYAIWSTNVDSIICEGLTPEQIIEMRVEDYRIRETENVNRVVRQLQQGGKPYFQFTMSHEDAVKRSAENERAKLAQNENCR